MKDREEASEHDRNRIEDGVPFSQQIDPILGKAKYTCDRIGVKDREKFSLVHAKLAQVSYIRDIQHIVNMQARILGVLPIKISVEIGRDFPEAKYVMTKEQKDTMDMLDELKKYIANKYINQLNKGNYGT